MDFSNIDYDALDQDISNTTTTETTELGNVNLDALEKDVFGDVQFKPPVMRDYKSMFETEDGIFQFSNPAQTEELKKHFGTMEDPEAEKRKYAAATYLAHKFKTDPNKVYDNFLEYSQTFYGRPVSEDEAYRTIGKQFTDMDSWQDTLARLPISPTNFMKENYALGAGQASALNKALPETMKAFFRGVDYVPKTAAAIADVMGAHNFADEFRANIRSVAKGEEMDKDLAARFKKNAGTWEQYSDFEWWAVNGAELTPFILGSIGATAVTGGASAAMQLGTAGTIALTTSGGIAFESMVEGAQTWEQVKNQGGNDQEAATAATTVITDNMALLSVSNTIQHALGFGALSPAINRFNSKIANNLIKTSMIAGGIALEPIEELSQNHFSSEAIAVALPEIYGLAPKEEWLEVFTNWDDPEKRDTAVLSLFLGAKDVMTGAVMTGLKTAKAQFQKGDITPADYEGIKEKAAQIAKVEFEAIRERALETLPERDKILKEVVEKHGGDINESNIEAISKDLQAPAYAQRVKVADEIMQSNIEDANEGLIKYYEGKNPDNLIVDFIKAQTLQDRIDAGTMTAEEAQQQIIDHGLGDKTPDQVVITGSNYVIAKGEVLKHVINLVEGQANPTTVIEEIVESRAKLVGQWSTAENGFLSEEYRGMIQRNRVKLELKGIKSSENDLEWFSSVAYKYALAEDPSKMYGDTFGEKMKEMLDKIREYIQSIMEHSETIKEMVNTGEFDNDFIQEMQSAIRGELPANHIESKKEVHKIAQELGIAAQLSTKGAKSSNTKALNNKDILSPSNRVESINKQLAAIKEQKQNFWNTPKSERTKEQKSEFKKNSDQEKKLQFDLELSSRSKSKIEADESSHISMILATAIDPLSKLGVQLTKQDIFNKIDEIANDKEAIHNFKENSEIVHLMT